MTREEANELIEKNTDLINCKVTYEKDVWIFKRFIIERLSSGDHIIKASLSKMPSVEFTVPFEDRKDFQTVK